MTPSQRSRVKIPLRHPSEAGSVPIVADATVAMAAVAEGRNIPLLILDTSSRPDIDSMVRAHELGPGDATSYWSFKKRWPRLLSPFLVVRTTKPSECVVAIVFDMMKGQGTLVDQILWAQCVYLQPGRLGDRAGTTIDSPKLLVEIPANEAFRSRFQSVYERAIFRKYRQLGMNRAHSRHAVQTFLKKWRAALHRPFPLRRNPVEHRTGATMANGGEDTGSG